MVKCRAMFFDFHTGMWCGSEKKGKRMDRVLPKSIKNHGIYSESCERDNFHKFMKGYKYRPLGEIKKGIKKIQRKCKV